MDSGEFSVSVPNKLQSPCLLYCAVNLIRLYNVLSSVQGRQHAARGRWRDPKRPSAVGYPRRSDRHPVGL